MISIKEQVEALVDLYQTNNPRDLCDYLGITILEMELHDSIQGFFMRVKNDFYIYVNTNQPEEEKRATLAHELGHRFLHPELNSLFMTRNSLMNRGRYENEADVFAAHLLVSDDAFNLDCFGCDTLERIGWELDVPLHFVEVKWHDLNS